MKTYNTLLLCLLLASCSQLNKGKKTQVNTFDISVLKHQKDEMHKYLLNHQNSILLFAKLNNKPDFVKVTDDKWPDDTECSYDVLKDDAGNIIMIMSSPMSESGDWNIETYHYFNKDGNIIAHEVNANAFVLPDEGVAYETTTDYYTTDFKLAKHEYELVDKKKNALDKKEYAFDAASMGLDLKAYSNVKECLAAYHIKLDN